ncbi:hypothetical protein DY926_07070 [Komagataeibacter melaceti]|uniref:Uncharacterized protein n=1 Tax=Komagataeibacter melaceti TaxID=2766577 RepID=A0A371Z170_9PROT|nr:hypothetical protein [Komagataeibacter melaceti]RFD20241.1 hypothetical protein DY926_07070 [Komagataeibacter melaceti]
MMSLPLYASLTAGWMVLAVVALLGAGSSLQLRGVLAFVLLGLGIAGHVPVADAAQAFMALCPALALCVETCRPADRGGAARSGGLKALLPFILSGNASLALAFGRCDLLGVFIGASLAVRLAGAWGPRGLDGDGWRQLRGTAAGLILAQGGLFLLRAGWGTMPDQAGAVLLAGGLFMACGLLSSPAHAPMEGNMDQLMVIPVIAQAAGSWPQLAPVLTFFALVCLAWSVLPRQDRESCVPDWGGWALLAAGLPARQASLPLAACLLMLACTPRVGHGPEKGREGMNNLILWPPFLPGVALVLVLVAQMRASVPIGLLAGVSLWPSLAGSRQAPVSFRGRTLLLLALGCMVLAIVVRRGMVQP